MVDPQASRFWQAALQSGLIDAKGLQACWDALPPEKQILDQMDRRLARQAVQANLLTLWQAQQLLAGRSTGFKINRYILLEMIGQGGMGRVYLAKDSRLNRRVALKILSPERVGNPRAIARFQREARVGAQLQHENLVRIYDEGESNGKCYLVMEFIEGKNIGTIIAENGPIPPSTAARLVRQVAMGLEHAQQKGLIHRDVNPYNILVTRDGTAKLTDLGLAIDLADQAQVTRDGATVGTFDYVSPEQARHSHSVDTRSDIYSLGCTLYHMLAGQVPFPSPSLPEKLFGHQAVEPELLSTLVPDTPEALVDIVRKMMAKSPDDRFPTPLAVAHALEPFIADQSMAYLGDLLSQSRSLRPTQTATKVTAASRGPAHAVTELATPPSSATEALASRMITPKSSPEPAAPAAPAPLAQSASGVGLESRSEANPTVPQGSSPSLAKARAASSAPPASPPEPAEVPGEVLPDFSKIGAEPAAGEDLSGLGLALNLTAESPAPAPKAKASKSDMPAPVVKSESKVQVPPPPPPEPSPAIDFSGIGSKPARGDDLSGLGLALDLGAQPAMAQTQPKPKPAAPAPQAAPAKAASRGSGRLLLLGGAAVLLLVAVAGGIFASGVLNQGSKTAPPKDEAAKPTTTSTSHAPVKKDEGAPTQKAAPEVPKGQAIAVWLPDGTVETEPDLKGAMQKAIGTRGHVLLNNQEPLKFSGNAAAIEISGGALYIRAAKGVRPVIEVEIKDRPFLATRSGTRVEIVGVSFVAHYVGQGQEAPPVIEAGANVALERCAFSATGMVNGSRAVAAEGGMLTAAGCWFEGFDKALDIAAFGNSTCTVRQCMMIRAKPDAQPIGWAVRVRSMPGGFSKTGRRLVFDHCTVKGKGLLNLIGFSPQSPYKVEVTGCAVQADTLLAWETPPPGTPLDDKGLIWSGHGNQYDVQGTSWVTLSSRESGKEMPGGPTNLTSWTKIGKESEALSPPVKFAAEPTANPTPQDFAVQEQLAGSAGADPKQVGP